ncbi:MAG TPA: ScpA family protein [Candidatus Paceibacterota bacterium]|jgi:segregation and condensation protein A
MPAYIVKTEVFRGPLELLLTLIEKRKLLINDISLAEVTDDFIAHLEVESSVSLSERAHFVLVASTLLLIKSKSLLPSLELTDEETASVEDLERRLKLYKRFRELSFRTQKLFGLSSLYLPEDMRPTESLFVPTRDVAKDRILAAIQSVTRALPRQEFIPKAIVLQVVSLEEMIETLSARIAKGISLSFREFAGLGKEEKTEVIVGFLAMLELVKRGMISVTQDSLFSDITMETDSVDTPHYG